jgi:hypothetical protein
MGQIAEPVFRTSSGITTVLRVIFFEDGSWLGRRGNCPHIRAVVGLTELPKLPIHPDTQTHRLSPIRIHIFMIEGCIFLRILSPLFPSSFNKAFHFSLYVPYNYGMAQSV